MNLEVEIYLIYLNLTENPSELLSGVSLKSLSGIVTIKNLSVLFDVLFSCYSFANSFELFQSYCSQSPSRDCSRSTSCVFSKTLSCDCYQDLSRDHKRFSKYRRYCREITLGFFFLIPLENFSRFLPMFLLVFPQQIFPG